MSEVAAGLPPPLNASEVHHCVLVKGLPWQASANAVASLFPAASGTPLLAYDASGEACVPFASAADARDALRVDGTVVNGWCVR